MRQVLVISSLAAAVAGQYSDSNYEVEKHPPLPIQVCAGGGSCTRENTSIVLDANYRWIHNRNGSVNCYEGDWGWNKKFCSDGKTCAENCAVDGATYESAYSITTPSSGALRMQFATIMGFAVGYSSRVFLAASENKYRMFNLLNKEFSFDVDNSRLPCGLNGALYFVEMDEDGGMSKYPGNKAGAKYGTGYCDSKCPRDVKFINGEANVEGWLNDDPLTRGGRYGSCCAELSVWDANSESNALSAHTCRARGQHRCDGELECNQDSIRGSTCDAAGCDFNPYRMGNTEFYRPGQGGAVNSSKPFTVVTQFVTADGTDKGKLSRINRFYVQDGKVIGNAAAAVPGIDPVNYISDKYCAQQKAAFGDRNYFAEAGGMPGMGKSLEKMVLVMGIWHDYKSSMNWLDSVYPRDRDPSAPGVARGRCDPEAGDAEQIEYTAKRAYVQFSNIKFGSINSTFRG